MKTEKEVIEMVHRVVQETQADSYGKIFCTVWDYQLIKR